MKITLKDDCGKHSMIISLSHIQGDFLHIDVNDGNKLTIGTDELEDAIKRLRLNRYKENISEAYRQGYSDGIDSHAYDDPVDGYLNK
jgi:hypothetical protein